MEQIKRNQSSVEWLIGEIIRHQMTFYGTSSMPLWIIEQAKAMHKEEIELAYNQGYRDGEHDASNIPLSIGDISEYNNSEKYYERNIRR